MSALAALLLYDEMHDGEASERAGHGRRGARHPRRRRVRRAGPAARRLPRPPGHHVLAVGPRASAAARPGAPRHGRGPSGTAWSRGSSSGCGRSRCSSPTSTAPARSRRHRAAPAGDDLEALPPRGVRRRAAQRRTHPRRRHRPDPRRQGEFRVLGDNLRCPSGVSYVLENRRTLAHVLPRSSPAAGAVRRGVPRAAARRAAGGGAVRRTRPDGRGAHPGVHNSAHFEHAFLARRMGVELVEGRDLFCRDDRLWMRTVRGRGRSTSSTGASTTTSSTRCTSSRLAARRARSAQRRACRQRRDRQRGRQRRRRRQGHLPARARR